MILELIVVVVLLVYFNRMEPFACRDLKLNDPPLASIYDVIHNKNAVFEKESASYAKELKKYFQDLKTYCMLK